MAGLQRIRLDEARLVREHDCLHAVADPELLKNVRDVSLDGGLADVELVSDLSIRAAGDHQANRTVGAASIPVTLVTLEGSRVAVLDDKNPALAGLSFIGAPRFELGTSSPPD